MKGGLRQRSPGTWQLNVYLGRGPDGHHKRRWETVRGTKADAQRRLRELLAELDRGVKPPERVLLKDWLQTWVTVHVATNRSATTVERYDGIIRRHIVPALGYVELSKLTPLQVQSLENRLLQEGMAPKSVVMVHAVLSGAYRYAMRMEVVSRNPVALVSAPSIRKREIQPPPVEVVAEMLHIARNEEHPKFPCIHLLVYTGLRLGEALGLTWNDVDLDDGHLVVRASLSRRMVGLVLSPPKTSSGERKVDLDAGTVAVLQDHRIRQDEVKAMMGPAYKDAGVVFCNGFGSWTDPQRVTLAVKALGKRVGFPNATSRSLRHFHATVALQNGTNIVVVSKRLGHSNVSITSDIYAHSLPGWQKQAAEDFAATMNSAAVIEPDAA